MTSWLRFPKQRSSETIREHYGARRVHDVAHAAEPGVTAVSFENYTVQELVQYLESGKGNRALRDLLHKYHFQRTFPDMSNFRLGPNMFNDIALDWVVFVSSAGGAETDLVAHGITTRINWDGNPATLPRGWTGAVRLAYEQSIIGSVRPTTLVGLFILAEKAFRKHGWAADVTQEMKRIAKEAGLRDLIIPLRLPTRYEHQNARVPYEEFAFLKRDDGQYSDHWLRMHVRLGAEVIGVSSVSHQHAMHPDDLDEQLHCGRKEKTGDYLVKWNEEYYNVFVDVEHGVAIMNQGCVWVRHSLRG